MTEDLKTNRLCAACIGEPYLAEQVMASGHRGVCDYCGQEGMTETLDDLAHWFEAMFEQHFEREGDAVYRWSEPHGEAASFIIADTGRLDEEPAADIQAILAGRHADFEMMQMGEPTAYDDDLTYVETAADDLDFQERWADVETELKTRRRFFNRKVEAEFDRLFADVHALSTHEGRPVVRTIGPDTDLAFLYRARAFQSDARFDEALIDPEQFIGTPASRHARAGRMNPALVAVFYGATELDLAVNEVRPPIGSRVVTARFDLLRPLQVLDVEALERVLFSGSLFDPAFSEQLARGAFLARLAKRIRMPVMPDDEGSEYLITQEMADYLADRIEPGLDGIVYGSAQGVEDGLNVALFNHAARVRTGEIRPGSTAEVYYHGSDDEPGDYAIWTEIDSSEPEPEPQPPEPFRFEAPHTGADDLRAETLVLDRSSLRVHRIERICVKKETTVVQELVWDKAKEPF